MKQLIQNFRTGETRLEEVPAPVTSAGQVLIRTVNSLVSPGTERMLVEFARASLLQKARQQPERVTQVLNKIKTDGLIPTIDSVMNKLDQPIPLGYCNVGVVIEVGEGVTQFQIGDRVVSNGPHAEIVAVSRNLVAKIPDGVSDEEAAFAVIGSIGLQGIRLTEPTFGEVFVVIGLGLIGLLTAQLLRANGCQVIGFDLEQSKVDLAKSMGIQSFNSAATDPVAYVNAYTQSIGADGVLIAASAKSNEIIHAAAAMSRKRGRIVLVGVIGLELNRADFYEKELSFHVSCSYGPGRYDVDYEQKGNDYPLPFVRWTAQRNFESVLNAISAGLLKVQPLISDKVEFDHYANVYNNLHNTSRITSIFSYPNRQAAWERKIILSTRSFESSQLTVGIIGAGNFTKATLLPALKNNSVNIYGIASANGLSGTLLAKKFGMAVSTTDYKNLLNDEKVSMIVITTRHSMHAGMVIESMNAGKHVFVEKPLAVSYVELQQIVTTYHNLANPVLLHVGFNRRFSPHIQKIKSLLGNQPGPMHIVITMNAGALPINHWTQDEKEGGRIIGEACHLVDLGVYLTGSLVKSVVGQLLGNSSNSNSDNASFLLKMENGSNVVINYFANGSKSYPKEWLELYYQDKTLVMDNFRETMGFGWQGFSSLKTSLSKGHEEQIKQLLVALKNREALIPFEQLVNVTAATLSMVESLKNPARQEIKFPTNEN